MQKTVDTDIENTAVAPFLKWAGGKRWLVANYRDLFPVSYDRYVEPFLGGGAVYFGLRPTKALLTDRNVRLIEAYREIQSNWKLVWSCLRKHHRSHSHDYYYEERNRIHRVAHERAAQFLYLNRTCWNGLYRVNQSGQFNVPIGTKNWAISEDDDFESIANALSYAEIRCADFADCLAECGAGDFIFADPPYTVAHNFNGFVRYNETFFTWKDQIRLRDELVACSNRGAKVLVTNANHPSIHELYEPVGRIVQLRRASVIGAKPEYRSATSELLIEIVT